MAGEHEIVREQVRAGNNEPDAFHTELNILQGQQDIELARGGGRGGNDWTTREAENIARRMDYGDGQGAANELASDLYYLRGYRYAQDDLLSQTDRYDRKYVGADILLNGWDQNRGTWDNVEILQNNGMPSIPITVYD